MEVWVAVAKAGSLPLWKVWKHTLCGKSSQATSANVTVISTLGVEKLNFRELKIYLILRKLN